MITSTVLEEILISPDIPNVGLVSATLPLYIDDTEDRCYAFSKELRALDCYKNNLEMVEKLKDLDIEKIKPIRARVVRFVRTHEYVGRYNNIKYIKDKILSLPSISGISEVELV